MTVKKFEKTSTGTVKYRPGATSRRPTSPTSREYVNYSTLETLRTYSAIALAVLFVLSLFIGWWVAGRAWPVSAITATAREISATDPSRRIPDRGPRDELGRSPRRSRDARPSSRPSPSSATSSTTCRTSLRNPVAVIQSNVDAVLLARRRLTAGTCSGIGSSSSGRRHG